MRTTCIVVFCVAWAGNTLLAQSTAQTNENDVSIRVQSVRINRTTAEAASEFGGRAYSDNTHGATIQFLVKLADAAVLQFDNTDSVQVDTFVDDTYQNLMAAGYYQSPYSRKPIVSSDTRSFMFDVGTSRAPANGAGRIFVRGKVEALIARGETKKAFGEVPLVVGRETRVGPFDTVLRSVSYNGTGGMNLTLSASGNGGRLLNASASDTVSGRSLTGTQQAQISSGDHWASLSRVPEAITVQITLLYYVTNSVRLDFNYVESAERVSIPFEAQIDIGNVTAGPMETVQNNRPVQNKTSRPWPPPKKETSEMPPRRPGFMPTNMPSAGGKR